MMDASKRNRYRERILSSVKEDENGCWLWQKAITRNWYGNFALGGGTNRGAHRVSGHPASKLTEGDVPTILRRLQSGEPKASIARSYGVSDRIILLISRGDLWRHAIPHQFAKAG